MHQNASTGFPPAKDPLPVRGSQQYGLPQRDPGPSSGAEGGGLESLGSAAWGMFSDITAVQSSKNFISLHLALNLMSETNWRYWVQLFNLFSCISPWDKVGSVMPPTSELQHVPRQVKRRSHAKFPLSSSW